MLSNSECSDTYPRTTLSCHLRLVAQMCLDVYGHVHQPLSPSSLFLPSLFLFLAPELRPAHGTYSGLHVVELRVPGPRQRQKAGTCSLSVERQHSWIHIQLHKFSISWCLSHSWKYLGTVYCKKTYLSWMWLALESDGKCGESIRCQGCVCVCVCVWRGVGVLLDAVFLSSFFSSVNSWRLALQS